MRVFGPKYFSKPALDSCTILYAIGLALFLAVFLFVSLSVASLHDGHLASSRNADISMVSGTRNGLGGVVIGAQGFGGFGGTGDAANATKFEKDGSFGNREENDAALLVESDEMGEGLEKKGGKVEKDGKGVDAEQAARCRPDQLIYVYDLPRQFNVGPIIDDGECARTFSDAHARNACVIYDPRFLGIGPPVTGAPANGLAELGSDASVWADTGQHALEIMFHQYLLKSYPCRARDPQRAAAFYAPLYAGLLYEASFKRYFFEAGCGEPPPLEVLGREFENTLLRMPFLKRNGGRDHFVTMAYSSELGMKKFTCSDSNLLNMTHTRTMTIMGIEAHWFDWQRQVNIPYPTDFHPTLLADITAHLKLIQNADRPIFASFAGSLDRTMGMEVSRDIRATIARHCDAREGACEVLKCENGCSVDRAFQLYLRSTFCLQPPGDSAARRGVFDALQAGCIPVVFMANTVQLYTDFLPAELREYAVFIELPALVRYDNQYRPPEGRVHLADDVDINGPNLIDVLRNVTDAEKSAKRRVIASLNPRLVYRNVARTLATGTVTVDGDRYQGELLGWKGAYETAIEAALQMMRDRVEEGKLRSGKAK